MKRDDVDVGNPFMFNPFALLNLEESYTLDLQILEKHYFEEQKKSHPDQFSKATEQEKIGALKKSTSVNQAYIVLKNPLSRAEYLLKAEGFEALSHDPSFLGTVMAWNERREQGEDLKLKAELLEKERILFHELEEGFKTKDYEQVRLALYQLTYVQKLLKQIGGRNDV